MSPENVERGIFVPRKTPGLPGSLESQRTPNFEAKGL
jgi:hypothetical protein